jgi:hypothetical protein
MRTRCIASIFEVTPIFILRGKAAHMTPKLWRESGLIIGTCLTPVLLLAPPASMLLARASARVHSDVLKSAVCAHLARFGSAAARFLPALIGTILKHSPASCSQFVALKFISKSVFDTELPYGVSAAPGSMPLVPIRRFSKIIQLVRNSAVSTEPVLSYVIVVFIFAFAAQGSGCLATGA